MVQTMLRDYLQETEDAISSGRIDEALSKCQQILAYFPESLEAQRLLGEVYLAQGKLDEAQYAFDWVLTNDPESVIAYCDRALISERRAHYDTALDCYQQAYELSRGNRQIRSEFNKLSAKVGQQGFMLSRAGLARLYMRGDLLPQAVQEWEVVLATFPDRMDARLGLLETYWREGLYDKVEQLASQILQEVPSCLKALLLLAHVSCAKNMSQSQELLRRVEALDPDFVMAQELFGDTLAAQPADPFLALLKRAPATLGSSSATAVAARNGSARSSSEIPYQPAPAVSGFDEIHVPAIALNDTYQPVNTASAPGSMSDVPTWHGIEVGDDRTQVASSAHDTSSTPSTDWGNEYMPQQSVQPLQEQPERVSQPSSDRLSTHPWSVFEENGEKQAAHTENSQLEPWQVWQEAQKYTSAPDQLDLNVPLWPELDKAVSSHQKETSAEPVASGWETPTNDEVTPSPITSGWETPTNDEMSSSAAVASGWETPTNDEVAPSATTSGWETPTNDEVSPPPAWLDMLSQHERLQLSGAMPPVLPKETTSPNLSSAYASPPSNMLSVQKEPERAVVEQSIVEEEDESLFGPAWLKSLGAAPIEEASPASSPAEVPFTPAVEQQPSMQVPDTREQNVIATLEDLEKNLLSQGFVSLEPNSLKTIAESQKVATPANEDSVPQRNFEQESDPALSSALAELNLPEQKMTIAPDATDATDPVVSSAPVLQEQPAPPVQVPAYEPAAVHSDLSALTSPRVAPSDPFLNGDLETTMKRPAVRLQHMQARGRGQRSQTVSGVKGRTSERRSSNKPSDHQLSNQERLVRGYQSQLAGEYDNAMQEYRIIIKGAPELLGEVISNVRALLKLAPHYSAGYRVLGDAYMRQGEYLQAMEAYNKALTMAKTAQS